MKKAIIVGIYGQDGYYLTKLLLNEGYEVFGLVSQKKEQENNVYKKCNIIEADISSFNAIKRIIKNIKPEEIYHLAAYHHSSECEANYCLTTRDEMLRVNFLSTKVMIDALLTHSSNTYFFYAGSSQMFTASTFNTLVNEETPFSPATYYGMTKVLSAEMIRTFRKLYNLKGCTAFLFNHESPRRSERFVSRKISLGVARIKLGLQDKLEIKNLAAKVDWGSAEDFVRGMFLMLSSKEPIDYVLATGELHTVEDFVKIAFSSVDLDWREYTKNEIPCNDSRFLLGDSRLIKKNLNWKCNKSFKSIAEEMVMNDLQILKQSLL